MENPTLAEVSHKSSNFHVVQLMFVGKFYAFRKVNT